MNNMKLVQTYAKSLLYVALAVATVLVTALADNSISTGDLVNLAIVGAGAIGVYVVPNLPGTWLGAAKTIIAFITAVGVGINSYLQDGAGIDVSQWIQIGLAAFAAIGVYIIPNTKPVAIVTVVASPVGPVLSPAQAPNQAPDADAPGVNAVG